MKHQDIISRMTLYEKAAILGGKNEWQTRDFSHLGIPSAFCSDGPHGLRKQAGAGDHLGLNPSLPATCFPTAATAANSWDEELGERIGHALGEEAAVLGVNMLLGPGLNMKRSPLCGRNFEYFAEDPYLAGKMAAAYVRGIQAEGICACPKHFAVNSQELRRMAMNAVVDERTLREIYLTGFEIAVKEGHAGAIMTSYNEVNGVYANENRHLLDEILRKEWGFDGVVVTDWGGSNDHVAGVSAGSDLEMPGAGLDSARQIVKAVEEKRLPEETVDACVDRLLEMIFRTGKAVKAAEINPDAQSQTAAGAEQAISQKMAEAHHALARQAARECIVLLKNEGALLPLAPETRVAVIGDFAWEPRYQGAGSSMVNPLRVECMTEEIRSSGLTVTAMARGYLRSGETSEELALEAKKAAKDADAVLFFFGLTEQNEAEGQDRTHLRIPENQSKLLEALAAVNSNIVGILSGGAVVETPWEGNCRALLHGYLGGQGAAGAVLDVLTGKSCPSGRLNETWPLRLEDTPAFACYPGKKRNSEYREGPYIGYRYYETTKTPVRYPFGYGLSYTEFRYENLRVTRNGISFALTNTGEMDGAEVCQMYVGLPGGKVFRPVRELKGFRKVFLKKGETRTVEIPFDDKTFRYWNDRTEKWEQEEGVYQIIVGKNAADTQLSGELHLEGTTGKLPCDPETMPSYYSGRITGVDDREFALLLGHEIPQDGWQGDLTINDALCQMYYAKNPLARFLCGQLRRMKEKGEKKGIPDLNILFIYNIPFRGIAKMTAGMVNMEMAQGMVTAVNGHFFRGIGTVISGFFRNRKANKAYEAQLAKDSQR